MSNPSPHDTWVWNELTELRKAEAALRRSFRTLGTAGRDGVLAFLCSLAELDRRAMHLNARLDGGAL
jgi:hypothetical protein